jgi:hypothetical protein
MKSNAKGPNWKKKSTLKGIKNKQKVIKRMTAKIYTNTNSHDTFNILKGMQETKCYEREKKEKKYCHSEPYHRSSTDTHPITGKSTIHLSQFHFGS